jgi:hypothetical protein
MGSDDEARNDEALLSLAIVASSVAASDRIEAAIHRGDARELDVTVVHREPFVVHERHPARTKASLLDASCSGRVRPIEVVARDSVTIISH